MAQKIKLIKNAPAPNLGAPRGYGIMPEPNTKLILEKLRKGNLPEPETNALIRKVLYSGEGKRLLAKIAAEKATRGPDTISERKAREIIKKDGHL